MSLGKYWKTNFQIVFLVLVYKTFTKCNDTDFFDIVARVFQGDMLAPYLFIICLDNILWMSIDLIKENGFKLKMKSSKHHPVETMTDTDYADDLAFFTNTPALCCFALSKHQEALASTWTQNKHFMCF